VCFLVLIILMEAVEEKIVTAEGAKKSREGR
jgi:hypothetical protein